jgi:hypothetical protein
MMIAEAVYFLCAAASIVCSVLLLRSFARTRMRLLLWSALCFCAFALTNVLLFVDLVLVPNVDLTVFRNAITAVGVGMMLYGLIGEAAR